MATYIGIKGVEIQTIAGDPANPIVGQVWYNTTANTLKSYGLQGTGAWASTGSLNTARNMAGGSGDTTAGLVFGGGPNSPALKDETETYDGSTWTEVGDMVAGRFGLSGCGTQTAALAIGGWPNEAVVEEWNGTGWTEIVDLNVAKKYANAAGTTTAAIYFGGTTSTDPDSDTTESWNGTAWTEVNDLNEGRRSGAGVGIQTCPTIGLAGSPAIVCISTPLIPI